jgi:hypothetical protein
MGACITPPNLAIVIEYMSRGSVFDAIHESKLRLSWAQRMVMALDAAKGMTFLHSKNSFP